MSVGLDSWKKQGQKMLCKGLQLYDYLWSELKNLNDCLWLVCNKVDCLRIRQMLLCLTSKLTYHGKVFYRNEFLSCVPKYHYFVSSRLSKFETIGVKHFPFTHVFSTHVQIVFHRFKEFFLVCSPNFLSSKTHS